MCEMSDRTAGVRTLVALVCAAFIPVFGACGSEAEAPDSPTAAVDTIGGVPRFTYPEDPATVIAWELDTIAVIGGYEQEEGAYQFDEVGPGGVAGDAHNALFVLDGAGRRVLGYDAGGEPIGVWGREGGGPGEMTEPSGLAVGPADSLWVVDRGNRRVTLFPRDPEGTTSEISLTDESSGLGGELAVGPAGVFGVAMIFSFSPGEEIEYPPRRLIHLQRDGEIVDTVWIAPPPDFDRVELTSGDGVAVMLSQRMFSPGFHWERFSDGSFAVAQETEYAFSILNGDGSERLHVRRGPPARVTTEDDRQRARDEARADADESTSPFVRNSIDERIEKMTFAESIPRITGLAVDGSDRLWVGVSEQFPGETERIDVYQLDGTLLGEIRDPSVFPTKFYGTGRAALLDRDELDVQRVVVLQLRERSGT
jgi:hypothetical protein